MTIPNIIKYLLLSLVFSGLVSLVFFNFNISGFFWTPASVLYGILAAGTLYYFNKTLWLQAIVVFIASSISLSAALYLDPGREMVSSPGSWGPEGPLPSILYISLIGGTIIWLAVLSFLKNFKRKSFAIFSFSWFAVCLAVGAIGENIFYGAVPPIMFVWQALTLFLIISFFSTLSTRNPVVSQTPIV